MEVVWIALQSCFKLAINYPTLTLSVLTPDIYIHTWWNIIQQLNVIKFDLN